jgi:SET domain-containing protein
MLNPNNLDSGSTENYVSSMGKKIEILFKSKALYVKNSNLPDAGLGLFALKAFKKGESLGPYNGKLLTMKECEEEKYLPLWGHMLDMTNIEGIEPYVALHPSKTMILRFINHAPNTIDGKKLRPEHRVNVEFSKIETHPYIEIKAIKDIDKDSEIYLNYGPGFSKLFLQNEKLRNFYLKRTNK